MNRTWERRRLAGVVMSSGPDLEVLSMDRRRPRQVLECASLLALWRWRRANRKRQRTGAVQDATARSTGSWSQGAARLRKLFMNRSPSPCPLPQWGERVSVGRVRGNLRFMAPMRAQKRKGAFHEPDLYFTLRRMI